MHSYVHSYYLEHVFFLFDFIMEGKIQVQWIQYKAMHCMCYFYIATCLFLVKQFRRYGNGIQMCAFPKFIFPFTIFTWAINTEVLDLQLCSSSSVFILTHPTECPGKIVLEDLYLCSVFRQGRYKNSKPDFYFKLMKYLSFLCYLSQTPSLVYIIHSEMNLVKILSLVFPH